MEVIEDLRVALEELVRCELHRLLYYHLLLIRQSGEVYNEPVSELITGSLFLKVLLALIQDLRYGFAVVRLELEVGQLHQQLSEDYRYGFLDCLLVRLMEDLEQPGRQVVGEGHNVLELHALYHLPHESYVRVNGT